jgi:hypothetical protein
MKTRVNFFDFRTVSDSLPLRGGASRPLVGVLVPLIFSRERTIGAPCGGPTRLGRKYDGESTRYGRLEAGWQFSLILLLRSGQSGESQDLLLA